MHKDHRASTGGTCAVLGRGYVRALGSLLSSSASRGLEAWKYGFVFSIGKITTLIGSVLGQPFVRFTSPKTVFLFGQAGYFAANVLYGVLYWTTGGNDLLGFALFVGAIGGLTESVYAVISYSMVSLIFYDNPGVAIAAMQFLWGTGGAVGAIIGGLLIDLWAYPLPFFVVPSLFIVLLPPIVRSGVFKRLRKDADLSCSEESAVYHHLLGDIVFAVCLINMILNGSIFGFNETTLEPYLQNFQESSSAVGSVFMTQLASFSVGAALAGIVCYFQVEATFIPVAHICNVLAYTLLGPAPFLPFEPNLYLIYLSQVLVGSGMALMCVLSYCHALKRAIKKGYHENIRTNTFLSSAMFSTYVIGAIISPPISGYVVETFGYRKGSMSLLGVLLAWVRHGLL
ncbi:unnamed protein product [Ixodes persulcatus]